MGFICVIVNLYLRRRKLVISAIYVDCFGSLMYLLLIIIIQFIYRALFLAIEHDLKSFYINC